MEEEEKEEEEEEEEEEGMRKRSNIELCLRQHFFSIFLFCLPSSCSFIAHIFAHTYTRIMN